MHICYMEKEFDVSPTAQLVKVLNDGQHYSGHFVVYSRNGWGEAGTFQVQEFVDDCTDSEGMPCMQHQYYSPQELWRDIKDHCIGECVCLHRSLDGEITFTHFDDEYVLPHKQKLIKFNRKDGAK